MIGHLSLGVTDLGRTTAFYDAAMEPIGFVRVWTSPRGVGYGPPGGGDKLALFVTDSVDPILTASRPGFHLAFNAPDRAAVDAFHTAALAHGGRDEGAPGLRPHYGEHYYAAFVTDPDGYRLEAVFQQPV